MSNVLYNERVALVRSFHAIRFPWLHHAKMKLVDIDNAGNFQWPVGEFETPEAAVLDPYATDAQKSRILRSYYQPIGELLVARHANIFGPLIREFITEIPYQELFDDDYQPAEDHQFNVILPDDFTLESMHYTGPQKPCKALITFITAQTVAARNDPNSFA